MKIPKQHAFSRLGLAALLALTGAFVGCGGDSDGGDDNQVPVTLDLTAANSDTVAHATGAGFMAFGSTVMLPLDASADRASALGSTGSGAWLPARVLDGLLLAMRGTARSGGARPLAVITMAPTECSLSGTSTMSFDDADNDGLLDIGEVFSFVFSDCQDSAADVMNGSMSGTITRINDSGTAFGARVTLAALAQNAVDGRHSLTLNGNVLLDYRELSATTEQMKLSADGAVTALVHTHLPFDDTVTLQSGFAQNTTHDYSLGRSTSTVTGVMESVAAGGSFAVSTMTPVELDDADTHPRAGVVEMRGHAGVMNLRALSAEQVQVELDANGDGSFESSTAQTWDWLF